MKHLVRTVAALAFVLIAGTSQINPSFATQLPNWIDTTPNNQNVGRVSGGPDIYVTLRPGQQAPVLGLRSSGRCGSPAPEFQIMMPYRIAEGFDIPNSAKRHTEIYNAGVGEYKSVVCDGRVVPARVIGVRIKRGYNGPSQFTLTPFPGSGPRVHVSVER